MKSIVVSAILVCCFIFSYGNNENAENYPVIGRPCPDFKLLKETGSKKSYISLQDFRGKWLILDFWSIGCTSCIHGFPEINKYQEKFKDRAQFVLVGHDWGNIRQVYEKVRSKNNLTLPCYYDSAVFDQFGIHSVPRTIIIDKQGIVRAITASYYLNPEKLNEVMEGKENIFPEILNSFQEDKKETESKYNKHAPILINNNGGNDSLFLYRSLLTGFLPEAPFAVAQEFIGDGPKNMIQFINVSLRMLYWAAYADTISLWPNNEINNYGSYWPNIIYKTPDSSLFMGGRNGNEKLYSYSLILPLKDTIAKKAREIMQSDLKNYFGFNVHVEEREMPCRKLIRIFQNDDHLKSKGGEQALAYTGNPMRVYFQNMPVSWLVCDIWYYHQLEPPVIDETGINYNIDIDFEALKDDIGEVREGLRKNGLDLVMGAKKMKVIVIGN